MLEHIDSSKHRQNDQKLKSVYQQASKSVKFGEIYHLDREIWSVNEGFAIVENRVLGLMKTGRINKNIKKYKTIIFLYLFDHFWWKVTYS